MDEQHFSHEYRTGHIQPKKSKGGLAPLLLICIIFLMGVVSAMGLLNIRLFHLLNQGSPDVPLLSFSHGDATTPDFADYSPTITVGDMTLVEISNLYQEIYALPDGLYVCYIIPDSPAAAAGIVAGDVLVMANGTPISTLAQAESLLTQGSVQLTLCRSGQVFTLTLP